MTEAEALSAQARPACPRPRLLALGQHGKAARRRSDGRLWEQQEPGKMLVCKVNCWGTRRFPRRGLFYVNALDARASQKATTTPNHLELLLHLIARLSMIDMLTGWIDRIAAQRAGYYILEGAFLSTQDDRLGRWYIRAPRQRLRARRRRLSTQRAAWKAAAEMASARQG